VQQLQLLDVVSTFYAVNMAADLAIVRVPERLYGQYQVYKENSIMTITNITPKFFATNLYVGK
jgi:hypothetical protein